MLRYFTPIDSYCIYIEACIQNSSRSSEELVEEEGEGGSGAGGGGGTMGSWGLHLLSYIYIIYMYITRGGHPSPWLPMWPWLRWAMVLRPGGLAPPSGSKLVALQTLGGVTHPPMYRVRTVGEGGSLQSAHSMSHNQSAYIYI